MKQRGFPKELIILRFCSQHFQKHPAGTRRMHSCQSQVGCCTGCLHVHQHAQGVKHRGVWKARAMETQLMLRHLLLKCAFDGCSHSKRVSRQMPASLWYSLHKMKSPYHICNIVFTFLLSKIYGMSQVGLHTSVIRIYQIWRAANKNRTNTIRCWIYLQATGQEKQSKTERRHTSACSSLSCTAHSDILHVSLVPLHATPVPCSISHRPWQPLTRKGACEVLFFSFMKNMKYFIIKNIWLRIA